MFQPHFARLSAMWLPMRFAPPVIRAVGRRVNSAILFVPAGLFVFMVLQRPVGRLYSLQLTFGQCRLGEGQLKTAQFVTAEDVYRDGSAGLPARQQVLQ